MATEFNQTFQALCDLAARPEYLAPLREEAETFFARSKEGNVDNGEIDDHDAQA